MGTTDGETYSDQWVRLGIETNYIAADLACWRMSRSHTEMDDLAIAHLVELKAIRYRRTRKLSDAMAVLAAALALLAAVPIPETVTDDCGGR